MEQTVNCFQLVDRDTRDGPALSSVFSGEQSKHVFTYNPGELLRGVFGPQTFFVTVANSIFLCTRLHLD